MLNKGQQEALASIKQWYKTMDKYIILDGAGGTGKSYLVNELLQQINCKPLLLAPTNEALKQLKDKVEGDYLFKTIHSALGITPTKNDKDLKFEQVKLPDIWDKHNLCIIDEASMIDDWILKILNDIGMKTIFIGHKSQLPPVKLKRLLSDKCISPVFDKEYKAVTLTEPMRNKGDLWDFNNHLESMIYTNDRVIPDTFDISKADFYNFLSEPDTKDNFLNDKTKIVLWSNEGVDRWNLVIRLLIHGNEASLTKYLPKDRIILTSPYISLDGLEVADEDIMRDFYKKEHDTMYSNTKAVVVSCSEEVVRLNAKLVIPVYKILVLVDNSVQTIYECINSDDKEKIGHYYEHLAWGKTAKVKEDAFRLRRFILTCFADIKHFFAASSHRLQGSSVPNVVVINSDIAKNSNMIEQKKCRYVATSRSIDNLYFYRGL